MSSRFKDVSKLVDQLVAASADLDGRNYPEARQQCLAAAHSLTFALETPAEAMMRHG